MDCKLQGNLLMLALPTRDNILIMNSTSVALAIVDVIIRLGGVTVKGCTNLSINGRII
jgi:hypothetical protein